MENKEDWIKVKEEERETSEALLNKTDAISSIHNEILNWWKQHEKSLVKEMMSGRMLNILNSESALDFSPTTHSLPQYDLAIDNLLNSHSNILKDIQLLKSRLQSAKRSLQRIKRKYSLEYSIWRKGEKSSTESLSENLNPQDELIKVHYETGSPVPTGKFHKGFEYEINNNQSNSETFSQSNISNYLESENYDEKELAIERSFSFYDSDLNTSLSDVNDSIFSTSTLISNFSRQLESKSATTDVRLVRSVSNLQPITPRVRGRSCFTMSSKQLCNNGLSQHSSRPLSVPSFHLTGDKDIDEEIIAFYKNKCMK